MSRQRWRRLATAGLVAAGLLAVAAIAAQVPAQAAPVSVAPSSLDPSSMSGGARPQVPYLLHDTIHDGHLTVRAPRGQHSQLWRVEGGYLVLGGGGRLVWIDRSGERQVLGSSVYTVAVSPSRTRVAWGSARGEDLGPPARLTVADVPTGQLVARRTFSRMLWAGAMTRHRVLLETSWAAPPPETMWWRPGRPGVLPLARQAAVGADVRADRVVFSVGAPDAFCNRVAPLDHPARTLWRSCHFIPRTWSPDGRRALTTHTYFDDAGTDYWSIIGARSGAALSRVTGRLDWNPAWEGRQHFLVSAMGDDGMAAVVRCDLHARCERATRLWDTGWTRWPPFYMNPPVLLARN